MNRYPSEFQWGPDGLPYIVKGPAEDLPYGAAFGELLEPGDTLLTAGWTVPAGLTHHGEAINASALVLERAGRSETHAPGTVAVIWFSGGTAGQRYRVDVSVTTAQGRAYARRLWIVVQER